MKPSTLYPNIVYGNKQLLALWQNHKDEHCVVASWFRGHRGYLIIKLAEDKYKAIYINSKKKGINPMEVDVLINFFRSKVECKYKSKSKFNELLEFKVLSKI